MTAQEISFQDWWNAIPEDERVAIFHKTQVRMAFNAGWKRGEEADNAALRAEVERLQQAFNIYGTHKPECMVPMSGCSCGFDAALHAGKAQGE